MRWKLQEDSAEAEGESVLFDCSERGVQVNLMEMGKDTQHFLEQPAASANESCKLISDLVHLLYFSSVWLRQTNFLIG